MAPKLVLRPPPNEDAICRYAELLFESFAGFGLPRPRTRAWLDELGHENLRIATIGKEIVGGLGLLFFGQWFGGRPAPSVGVSAVGVAPHWRGAGVGTEMMRALIRELASAGAALSSLYPSTLGLYRKAGYEAAGVRFACAVPIARLEATVRELRLRPFEPRDLSGVQRVYRDRAARAAGNVERPERMWKRLLSYHSDDKIYANVVEGPDGAIVGYMIHIVISGEHCFDIRIRDMAALTPAAGRRLLTFLADHGTFGRRVVWNTGVIDPVFTLAREQPLTVEERGLWMLRIVRAREALQARGYPRGVRAELSLTLEDDLLPENCGRFTLRVADGNAELAEGGEGRIQVGVRGLASLYSGHRSALELQAAGLLDGPADDLSLADALFCGPTPWMNDGF